MARSVPIPLAISVETRLHFPDGRCQLRNPGGPGDFRGELRLLGGKVWTKKLKTGSIALVAEGEFGLTLRGNAAIKTQFMTEPLIENYAPEVYARAEIDGIFLFRRYGLYQLIVGGSFDYRASTTRPTPLDPDAGFRSFRRIRASRQSMSASCGICSSTSA